MGQGAETAFAQVVSEVFGIGFDAVKVHAGDTMASPLNTGAFASRTMIAAAGALREAAEALAAKTLRLAAWRLETDVAQLEIAGSVVRHREDPSVQVALAEIFTTAITGQGIAPAEDPGLEADGPLRAVGRRVFLRHGRRAGVGRSRRPATSTSSVSCWCTTPAPW